MIHPDMTQRFAPVQLDIGQFLTNHHISQHTKLVVGISGGPDSTCLLYLLHKGGIPIVAAHVNYQLRGADSLKDEQFVRDICKKWRIPLRVKRVDKRQHPRAGLQQWARDLRFTFFSKILKQEKCAAVALAHTADDQAETVFFRLLRNASLKGLMGMQLYEYLATYRLALIRPLLRYRKTEILTFLQQEKQSFRIDKSNLKTSYARNKIRHLVFPQLATQFRIDPVDALVSISSQFADINRFLDKEAGKAYKKVLISEQPGVVRLSRAKFNALDPLVSRYVVRLVSMMLSPTHPLSQRACSELQHIAKKRASGLEKQLTRVLLSTIEYDTITIERIDARSRVNMDTNKRNTRPRMKLALQHIFLTDIIANPTPLVFAQGEIHFSPKIGSHSRKNPQHDSVDIDLEKTGSELIVRSRKPGDRMYPAGMTGTKKLQDLFIDNKVPRRVRDQLPVLCTADDEIIWIPGIRADKRFVSGHTSRRSNIVTLTYLRYTTLHSPHDSSPHSPNH